MSVFRVHTAKFKQVSWGRRGDSFLWFCLSVLVFWCALITPAGAQAEEIPEVDPANQVIQQLDQEDRLKRILEATSGLVFSPTVTEIDPDEECFEISNIRVEGVTVDPKKNLYIHRKRPAFNRKGEFVGDGLLAAGTVEEIVSRLSRNCMGVTAINHLIAALTDAYVTQGYITTRVFIPNQDLSTGDLVLVAVEGTIEKIIPVVSMDVKNPEAAVPVGRVNQALLNAEIQINAAFPTNEGDFLNLRLLEQAVENLNAVPSTRASLQLLPGESIGGTIIPVSLEYDKPWRLAFGLNDSGELNTGTLRVTANAEYDNFFNVNDQISLDYEGSIDTNIVVGRVKIPSGLNDFEMTVSYSEFRFLLDELTELFSMFASATVRNDYLMMRDALDKHWVYGKATMDGSQRYINGVELTFVGNRMIEVGYRNELQVPEGRFAFSPGAGKMFWDVFADIDLGSRAGTNEALDPNLRVVFNNTWFQPLSEELSWTSTITGQISSSEQRLARQLSLPTLSEIPVTIDSGISFEQKILIAGPALVPWLAPFDDELGLFSLTFAAKGGYGLDLDAKMDVGTLTNEVGLQWHHGGWEFGLGYELPVLSLEASDGTPQFNLRSMRRF